VGSAASGLWGGAAVCGLGGWGDHKGVGTEGVAVGAQNAIALGGPIRGCLQLLAQRRCGLIVFSLREGKPLHAALGEVGSCAWMPERLEVPPARHSVQG
jgi:hypothetical protein